MIDDLLLSKRIKEGDINAFESLFRRYYLSLCRYVASITGEIEIGEEVVEELFYVLWRDRAQLSIFHSVKSYLYKAARNGAFLYCEHREVRQRYIDKMQLAIQTDEANTPQQEFEYKELQLLVERTLRQLPERRSRIFSLHRDDGKRSEEHTSELQSPRRRSYAVFCLNKKT